MSNKRYNFCPFCGKRLLKFDKNKTNFCCYCGKKLKIEKEKLKQKVQCTICHIMIDPNKYKIIKCTFCGSMYHSTCVSSWLQKYNACPMCQNVFLFPNKAIALNK
ncbi:MAG: RING finger domain-containing protein [Candidatus Lokiarchaeia archaeon]